MSRRTWEDVCFDIKGTLGILVEKRDDGVEV